MKRTWLRTAAHRILALGLAAAWLALAAGCDAGSLHPGGETETQTQTGSEDAPALPTGGSGPVYINEYMSKNSLTIYTAGGDYADWLELYNASVEAVDLGGWYLSDNPEKPEKWAIPKGTAIGPGAYLLIWCSGAAEPVEGELHAPFKLGQEDLGLVLSDPTLRVVDGLAMAPLQENVSYGRSAEDLAALLYFTMPTPGAKNGDGFAELALNTGPKVRELIISEVSAAWAPRNKNTTQHDWIELHNLSQEPVALQGYGLCKSPEGSRLVFGEETLAPGAYLVVQAEGREVLDTAKVTLLEAEGVSIQTVSYKTQGEWHAPFQVDTSGELLCLLDPEGEVVDAFDTGKLRIGVTSGRAGDSPERVWFANPTPGAANGKPYRGYAPLPVLSRNGGYAEAGEVVTAGAPESFTLRYTADGSVPTESSPVLGGGLRLAETVTLKVRAFGDNLLPSETVTASFLVGGAHQIPIVCVSGDPDDLLGHNNGILADGPGYGGDFPYFGANFWKNWEREATLEYYSAQGVKQVEFPAGLSIFGQYTRAYPQKAMAVHLRDSYGARSVTYPFFEGNPITTNTDFVLRAAGQDQYRTKFRDAFCTQVLRGYSDVLIQDWQPVAVYINGAYWGLYELREKINNSFFASREGLDPRHMDRVKGDNIVQSGSKAGWKELREYARDHDMTQQAHYDYIRERLDIDNYIDYLIAEIFFANSDTGNIKCYRESQDGANGGSKWRMVLYDLDMTMRKEAMGPPRNTMKELLTPGGHGAGNMFYTWLQVGLLKNADFRKRFRDRYLELLDTAFKPENMEAVLDRMAAMVEPEIAANYARWNRPTPEYWRAQVEEIREICYSRPTIAKQQLEEFFR